MLIIMCQIGTIICMGGLTVYLWRTLSDKKFSGNERGKSLWVLKSQRVGKSQSSVKHIIKEKQLKDKIELPEAGFTLGNGLMDDIFIDACKTRVKLYLNIQKDRIFLTVLKGKVVIQNYIYSSDVKKIIEMKDLSRMEIGEVSLQFQKKRVM